MKRDGEVKTEIKIPIVGAGFKPARASKADKWPKGEEGNRRRDSKK
jgi:hypothetical protein